MGGARPANWAPHAEGPPVKKKKIRYGLRGYISVGWKPQLLSMHGETIISVPVQLKKNVFLWYVLFKCDKKPVNKINFT